jgi:hypothetical protein
MAEYRAECRAGLRVVQGRAESRAEQESSGLRDEHTGLRAEKG